MSTLWMGWEGKEGKDETMFRHVFEIYLQRATFLLFRQQEATEGIKIKGNIGCFCERYRLLAMRMGMSGNGVFVCFYSP
jgi:hypothetical protein